MTPPTYFNLNLFTAPFQMITDTYGIPNYKEVNPTFFGMISFPFEFGVMFGDLGHGFMILLAASLVCMYPDHVHRAGLGGLAKIRYMLLLMGVFATFMGMMYNDMMSIPIQFLDSCYHGKHLAEDCVYSFGLDWKWYSAHNELNYFNSMKMKMAVIIGVSQMSLGILMKGFNAVYFRNMLDFVGEFVPQMIMMLALFGWMDFLIIMKWLTPWVQGEGNNTYSAPSIISTMISMFLNFGQFNRELCP